MCHGIYASRARDDAALGVPFGAGPNLLPTGMLAASDGIGAMSDAIILEADLVRPKDGTSGSSVKARAPRGLEAGAGRARGAGRICTAEVRMRSLRRAHLPGRRTPRASNDGAVAGAGAQA